MKHCVCFSLIAIALLVSCSKHDEISFSGTVVNIEYCATQDMNSNAGFYTALETPSDIGGTFIYGADTFQNVVVLYEPGRQIKHGSHISGKFYIDNKYSKSYCTIHIAADEDLPQGVFTKVYVD